MEVTRYPDQFADFLAFLCEKYHVERNGLFVEYSSSPPPPLKGTRAGYYEGLLSFRERDGNTEFLVRNLKSGDFNRHMRPPDDEAERGLDDQALKDLAEFQRLDHR